jgi:caffeoyl-CoA O-methyltransferase
MLQMTRRSHLFSQDLQDYLDAHGTPPDEVLTELAAETARRFPERARMQIGPDQGAFMTMLARLTGAVRAVEVGTFTGYSAICVARGLADGGRLTCCDVSEEWTSLARDYWQKAGLAGRIELRLGPALDTLRALPPAAELDLSFIDADKGGYIGYWEEIVPRTRRGGLILADNTLAAGRVADPAAHDAAGDAPMVQAIRAFNDHVAADDRVEQVLLPIGDGLTVARRR